MDKINKEFADLLNNWPVYLTALDKGILLTAFEKLHTIEREAFISKFLICETHAQQALLLLSDLNLNSSQSQKRDWWKTDTYLRHIANDQRR